jgi:NAD(P) transhydrogenase subunit alpha
MSIVTELAILVLAGFIGFAVISKVPNTLHTPLMSGTNAIHGIVLLGGLLLIAGSSGVLEKVLLVIAIAFGTINIIGGFLVTDRMLGMFKPKPTPVEVKSAGADSIEESAGADVKSAGADSIEESAGADVKSAKADSIEESAGADSSAGDVSPSAGGDK